MQHDIYSLGLYLLEVALWQSWKGGFTIKKRLVALAKDRLPCLVGDRYANLVTACLCSLDRSEDNVFENESHVRDDDGIVAGVRYIENVSALTEVKTVCFVDLT
jgi:hypothetical protein